MSCLSNLRLLAHIVLCFCYVFRRLLYAMLPVSLDCLFVMALRYSLTFIEQFVVIRWLQLQENCYVNKTVIMTITTPL